jgi:hypothetical protein
MRWHAWFHNATEAPYLVAEVQDRIVLTPGQDGSLQRQISWRCGNKLTMAYVQLREPCNEKVIICPAAGSFVSSQGGKAAYYAANIKNLQQNKTYEYRLVNGVTTSAWYSFNTTADRNKVKFIFLGDMQQERSDGDFYHLQPLRDKYPDVDFWAFSGDLIEGPTDEYWNLWFMAMGNICPTVPIIASTGNHEYLKGLSPALDSRWKKTFVYPENGPSCSLGSSYYIDYKTLRMIVIDSQGINSLPSLLHHREWLAETLQGAGKKWKIVIMHHPIYSPKRGRDNLIIRLAFQPILEFYKADLVLTGHDHIYARTSERHRPIYIVTACSPKHYKAKFQRIFTRFAEKTNTWQYVEISDNKLVYKSFLLNTNHLFDSFTLTR